MTLWACPRCPYTTQQPDHITAVGHYCNPNIPKTWRQLNRQTPPATVGGNQEKAQAQT